MADANDDNLDDNLRDNLFAEQVTRYFNGPLEPGDLEALEARLATDPAARKLFVQIASLDGLMTEQAVASKHPMSLDTDLLDSASNSDPSSLSLDDAAVLAAIRDEDVKSEAAEAITLPPPPPALIQTPPRPTARFSASMITWISAAAAVLLIGTLVAVWAMRGSHPQNLAISPTGVPQIAGNIRIGAAVQAQWDSTSPSPQLGDTVPNQPLYLRSGWVRVDFPTGVTTVIEAPAKFQVESGSKVALNLGRIAADVPPAGHGFAIESPTCRVVDLGTDFGLSVTEQGQSEVQVFKGQVTFAAKSKDTPAPPEVLSAGYGRRLDAKTQVPVAIPADPATFVQVEQFDRWVAAEKDAAKDRLTNWRAFNEQLSRDPSLMLFYTFDDTDPHTIINHAGTTQGRYDLVVDDTHGPTRVAGRQAGISALDFDPALQQYLIQPICPASQTGQMSGTAWIFVRNDVAYGSVIKNWGDTKSGLFHLGLDGTGRNLEIELDGTRPGGPVVRDPDAVPTGKWVHVAFVSDGTTARLYRDGKEVASGPSRLFPTDTPMKCLSLGCKTNDEGTSPSANPAVGYWDGQIGEIALFDRPLSPAEIAHMSQIARP